MFFFQLTEPKSTIIWHVGGGGGDHDTRSGGEISALAPNHDDGVVRTSETSVNFY
jgi:hypothetical protein